MHIFNPSTSPPPNKLVLVLVITKLAAMIYFEAVFWPIWVSLDHVVLHKHQLYQQRMIYAPNGKLYTAHFKINRAGY